ncbi:hypothetical protein ACLB2K_046593 [Fragaria x ananassa]
MSPTSGKRKRQAEQSQRLMQEIAQQYRHPTEVSSQPMVPLSSSAPPLPPPLSNVNEPFSDVNEHSSDDHRTDQSSIKISVRRKPRPESGNFPHPYSYATFRFSILVSGFCVGNAY